MFLFIIAATDVVITIASNATDCNDYFLSLCFHCYLWFFDFYQHLQLPRLGSTSPEDVNTIPTPYLPPSLPTATTTMSTIATTATTTTTTYYLLPITYCLLHDLLHRIDRLTADQPTTYYLPPTTYHWLPATAITIIMTTTTATRLLLLLGRPALSIVLGILRRETE